MFFRLLSLILGMAFVGVPFLPGAPRVMSFAPILGIVFVAYAIGGQRLLTKMTPHWADSDGAPMDAPHAAAHAPLFALFMANWRMSFRRTGFMLFSLATSVAVAWWWQFAFDVPRDQQGDRFLAVSSITVLALMLARTAWVTRAQRQEARRGRSDH